MTFLLYFFSKARKNFDKRPGAGMRGVKVVLWMLFTIAVLYFVIYLIAFSQVA